MRRIAAVLFLAVAAAGTARGQATIDPGMTKDQVVAKLGRPTSEHSSGTSTFLYYSNGQEKKMGMSDMVAMEDGKVVDAVFRSSARRYSGKSSSPAPVSTEAAIERGGGKVSHAPLKVPAKAVTKKTADTKKAPDTKKATPATMKKP